MRVRRAFLFLVAAGAVWTSPAHAQGSLQAGLKGHSIIANLSEVVMSRRRGTASLNWSTIVYISEKARIFARHDVKSSDPSRQKFREISPEGEGSGGNVQFQWTGAGLARQWVNRNGNTVRQTISISATPSGYACRLSVSRARGRVQVMSQSCRVVKGNAVAS
jgi:hypothetical protein